MFSKSFWILQYDYTAHYHHLFIIRPLSHCHIDRAIHHAPYILWDYQMGSHQSWWDTSLSDNHHNHYFPTIIITNYNRFKKRKKKDWLWWGSTLLMVSEYCNAKHTIIGTHSRERIWTQTHIRFEHRPIF